MSGRTEKISEVAPGIFRIVVQLPIPEVGSMNSYVIVDGDRNLIVDPGMAHPACYELMEKAIEDLGLDLVDCNSGNASDSRECRQILNM
jgi:glyoxylase-like metal-dependent hydrolase (beta-lactamase superfamily II)